MASGHNRAELERLLGHANDRYLRLDTNPPDDIAAKAENAVVRNRSGTPGNGSGDAASVSFSADENTAFPPCGDRRFSGRRPVREYPVSIEADEELAGHGDIRS
ncbi:hypothetical protein ACFLIM_33170 [Nonomuraea sp. M3C6]|uniref:Uncharacterized protein n=1 Tax=Nonomuraea marmarensis TaxID=3351344 RepID=A0ABW7AL65_9ACTN